MMILDFLSAVWNFFAAYVLQKAPYMVGFLTLLGYTLMGKKWYDIIGSMLKAIIGKPYFVGTGEITESTNYVWWCFDKSLNFAVYLAILQLGVRTFVWVCSTGRRCGPRSLLS